MTYHSEVVGSLLRPTYLVEARKQFETGQLNAADFKAVEDRAVNEAIALQETAGIDVITDGEMRRYAFYGHLVDALEGFDKYGGWAIPFRDETGEELVLKRPVVVERLKWRRSMCSEEWVYLRSRKTHAGKVTMISAQQAAAYCDPDKLIDLSIEMDKAIIRDHPGITFGMHVCRGNNQSKFYASGDYEPISRIFTQTLFQRFLLEYDDSRSGGFEPLRHVPEDRFVVLGLVTTKKPRLETADELRQRIEEASRYIPLERLALSPQCGFASTMEGNRISPEDQRRKLELVASVAREVWGS